MRLALVGVTGLVGQTMIKILEERNFPVDEFIPVASDVSAGKEITFNGQQYQVIGLSEALKLTPSIALFSAGGTISEEWAEKFADAGCTVIDNSSIWRMKPGNKLIVPEINAHLLTKDDKIIANPNCSTIQMVMALHPLHQKYKIKRVVVSTYQSVSGTGKKAIEQLENERKGLEGEKVYPHPIDKNCFPHGGDFLDNGYTTEEMKLVNETRKILGDDSIQITATVVRIPVVTGHSESINIEFINDFEIDAIRPLLKAMPGVVVLDDPAKNEYPMPIYAEGKDAVFVGRIRRDGSKERSLDIWVVSDNLRKGAATNAVQIAEQLVKHDLL